MKKTLILGASMLATVVSQAATRSYQCTQTGNKPWGSAKVTEDPPVMVGNLEVVRLSCTDPGNNVCQFSDGHCPASISQAVVDHSVREEIAGGHLSGTISFPGGQYSWNANSADDFSYEITED